jgi:short-subunit dehydrogenase
LWRATSANVSIERFAGIDTLVNNAGFGAFGIFETSTPELVMRQFQVNVFGVMDTIRAVLPHFRQRGAGTIVNVSSGAGVFTLPLISLYCASKFALEGFSEALSYELAALNIAVKIVEPGGVSGTNFGRRSGQEAAANREIPEYAPFLRHAGRVFEALVNAELSTAEDVANAIFIAVTDGSEQLRYVQGKDIEPLVTARRLGEDGYLSLLREQFGRLGKLEADSQDFR